MTRSSASRNLGKLAAAIAVIASGTLRAQTPAEDLQRMKRAWHDATGVELKNNTTIMLVFESGTLTAVKKSEQERMVLKGVPGVGSEDAVHYSQELMSLGDINAYTLSPGDRGYKKLKVETITHKDELDDQIFHDDRRSANFMYPQVEPGAITHLDYSLTYSDPRLITGHFFGSGEPVEESALTIISDPGVEFDVRLFHVDRARLEVERTVDKGRNVLLYRMRKLDAFRGEDDAPGFRYYLPHAQVLVTSYSSKGKKVELLGTTDRLYGWYYSHIREARAVTPEIQALVDSIVDPAAPEVDNVRSIFHWVQEHVSYVAFEAGMKGLVPARAEEVLHARYGDCKGMSCLLVNMLEAADIDAHLTWIGSREIPYSYDSIPSPAVDDHMIVVYDPEGRSIILDATENDVPFGMPSYYIQGKTMMISLDSARYLLKEVPVMPAEANAENDTTVVHVEGNGLAGTSSTWYAGYARSGMVSLLRRVKTERHQELLRAVLERGNNKFNIGTFTIEGEEDRLRDLNVKCTITIGDIVQRGSGELFVNLNLHRPWDDRNYKKDRTVAVENPYANVHRSVTELELPEGYVVGTLPATTTFTDPRFGYSIAYEEVASEAGRPARVRCRSEFTENELLLDAGDIAAWQDMMKQLRVELDRSIVLRKP